MKTSREMREAAWRLAVKEHRFSRIFWAGFALTLLMFAGVLGVAILFENFGVQTWDTFNQARLEAQAEGLNFVPPNRAAMLSYTYGSLFQYFVQILLSGIMAMGLSAVALSAADRQAEVAGKAFVGLKYPLGCASLQFLMTIRIWLWTLLFVIPGFIAYYRYRQAWYLKTEHPEWGAWRCLKESGRLMRGNKWRMFCFDCSYWLSFLGPLVLFFVGELVMIASFNSEGLAAGAIYGAVASVALLAATVAMIFVAVYILVGHAVFYRELNALEEKKDDAFNR